MIVKFLTYLALEKKYSHHTLTSYEKDLLDFQEFIRRTEGEIDWNEVSLLIMRNFMYELSEQSLTERTINRKISSLKSFFKFLKNCDYLDKNPSVLLESLTPKKKVIIPLSQAETLKLQSKSSDSYIALRNSLIVELLYQTGMRRIELINLQISNISFSNKQLKVVGKRNKERYIPLSDNLLDSIKEFLTEKALKNEQSGILFESNTHKKLSEKTVYNIVTQMLNAITSKSKTSPHILRHTFATHLLQNGAEINSVKELLGHTSLAATQVYTHHDIEQLKKVFNQAHPRELHKIN